jgi:rod shape determining protein RodA
MIRTRTSIFQDIDWMMLLLYLALVFMGWFNIYAAVYNEDHQSIFDTSQQYGHQLMFIFGALFIAIIILFIDANFFATFAYPVYAVVMVACVLVIFLGTEISGSKSWFRFGSFGLQPAEFGKFATCMVLAKYLSTMNIRMKDLSTKLISGAIILLPILIIIAERETGSAIIYSGFIFVMYREGLSGNILLLGLYVIVLALLSLVASPLILIAILGVVAVVFFLIVRKTWRNILIIGAAFTLSTGIVFGTRTVVDQLPKHQQTRIKVLLGMEQSEESKKKEGYNVYQSKVAIGSGGFWGKGFLQGTQTKYDYVPEQSTDFIFCTVGEEWGFVGSTLVLLLFLALIWRIIFVAERQRSMFSRIYGYGVASILFVHVAINIGMTIGLAPVIGIPLPFFSYGGSSLWSFTILLFIFIRLDSDRLQILR